jgi:hypothetical protein
VYIKSGVDAEISFDGRVRISGLLARYHGQTAASKDTVC